MSEPMKGLRAEILRSTHYSPGVSTDPTVTAQHVTIVAFDGEPLPENMRVFDVTDDAPAVMVEHNTRDHLRAVAIEVASGDFLENGRQPWRMASGAWIHCGDGRMNRLAGTSYPIPLHDRVER